MLKSLKKIKIMHLTYRVVVLRDYESQKENVYGYCDNSAQVLGFWEKMSKERAKEVVLHEIIHALNHTMKAKSDEEIARRIAAGITTVLVDNPKLRKWLLA